MEGYLIAFLLGIQVGHWVAMRATIQFLIRALLGLSNRDDTSLDDEEIR